MERPNEQHRRDTAAHQPISDAAEGKAGKASAPMCRHHDEHGPKLLGCIKHTRCWIAPPQVGLNGYATLAYLRGCGGQILLNLLSSLGFDSHVHVAWNVRPATDIR